MTGFRNLTWKLTAYPSITALLKYLQILQQNIIRCSSTYHPFIEKIASYRKSQSSNDSKEEVPVSKDFLQNHD
ncbi:hypothetical protein LSH36_172g04004 [Paralvinella palmiformis]|uniref:Uncharacterized protein n=1 Tax=Paralvinella palmiformis TaxID=53620 RepID=A0AAD9JSX9_9ANNE|nr:hypothetical protein LSH36_172g04004 [Paralvinella palmiformis]